MAKKNVSPIMTWAFWSILLLSLFLLITWEYFIRAFATDSSRITWAICGFFIYGFSSSFLAALHLQGEFRALRTMENEQRIGRANASDFAALMDAAMERNRRGERVEVRNLLSAYGAKIKARIDNVGVLAGMLITIGLLGTVVGLIMTIKGLDVVLQSNSADFGSMKIGLSQAVQGMGTAFYTTFVGAMLGGVVLKVLGSELRKSGLKLVADSLAFSELFVAPLFSKNAAEALSGMEERVVLLDGQLGALSESFGSAVQTLDSKQTALAAGLSGLVETVDRTNREAAERTESLVGAIAQAVEGTTRQADERLAALTATLEQTTAQTAERSTALVKALSEGIEGVNHQADERLHAVAGTVGSAVEETTRSAAEQLEAVVAAVRENVTATNEQMAAKIGELAETFSATVSRNTDEANRLADERLQAVLKAVEEAAATANDKADRRLADMVGNVETSVEKSRRNAEERLGAKAADLAGKLSEAASMLAGMTNAATPENQTEEG